MTPLFSTAEATAYLGCTSSLWRNSELTGMTAAIQWLIWPAKSGYVWTNFKMFSCISSLISVKYQRASHVDLGPKHVTTVPGLLQFADHATHSLPNGSACRLRRVPRPRMFLPVLDDAGRNGETVWPAARSYQICHNFSWFGMINSYKHALYL